MGRVTRLRILNLRCYKNGDVSENRLHTQMVISAGGENPVSSNGQLNQRASKADEGHSAYSNNQLKHLSYKGPPPPYMYLGDCKHACQHGGALFWYEKHAQTGHSLGRKNH
nr:hypothetical protein [Tanacetum cinerariifolium]